MNKIESGYIYLIKNSINAKGYVGLTRRHPEYRFKKHLRDAINGRDTYLCRAIRKYGQENFTFEVIYDTSLDGEIDLGQKEIDMIAKYRTHYRDLGYNMTTGGDGGAAGRPCSEETSRKLSIAGKGRKHSIETIEKCRATKLGELNPNYQKVYTQEERNRLSAQAKGHKNPRSKNFLIYNLQDGGATLTYDRAGFCERRGLNYWGLRAALARGKVYKNTYYGFTVDESIASELQEILAAGGVTVIELDMSEFDIPEGLRLGQFRDVGPR